MKTFVGELLMALRERGSNSLQWLKLLGTVYG